MRRRDGCDWGWQLVVGMEVFVSPGRNQTLRSLYLLNIVLDIAAIGQGDLQRWLFFLRFLCRLGKVWDPRKRLLCLGLFVVDRGRRCSCSG